MKSLEQNLLIFSNPNMRKFLTNIQRGIERETLRVDNFGSLSKLTHPKELGPSLTNPYFTTDYSEALLEFVTPTFNNANDLFLFLTELHAYADKKCPNEHFWPLSIPHIKKGMEIPIAKYGESNIGRLKHLYRVGLKNRYGSAMQTISGIHYNFSIGDDFFEILLKDQNTDQNLSDFKSDQYIKMIRNIHSTGWILLYLFGASPTLSKDFLRNDYRDDCDELEFSDFIDNKTVLFPYATSLRMSNLGYQNSAQKSLNICYKNLEDYIQDLKNAMKTPFADWEKIGVKQNGEYKQISSSILQIENEYYSSVRPKQIALPYERPSSALSKRGVRYVELRSMDLNPYSSIGISKDQIKFLDVYMLYCMLEKSCCSNKKKCHQKYNQNLVTFLGRKDGLLLKREAKDVPLKVWAIEIFSKLRTIAKVLDNLLETGEHLKVVEKFYKGVEDPSLTLSARMIQDMKETNLNHLDFGLQKAKEHKEKHEETTIRDNILDQLRDANKTSALQLREIETSDNISFEQFLECYIK